MNENFAQQILPSYEGSDEQFLNEVHDKIKGTEKDMVVFEKSKSITPEIIKGILHELVKLRIPVGQFLISEALYCDTLLWGITEEMFKDREFMKNKLIESVEADKKIFGVPVVNTLSNALVWDNRFYLFGIPEWLEKDLGNCIRVTLK